MTSAEVQAILTTIDGHIDGKAGAIENVSINNGDAQVILDWTAFVDNFSGQAANSTPGTTTVRWTKTINGITYVATQPSAPATQTVPVS